MLAGCYPHESIHQVIGSLRNQPVALDAVNTAVYQDGEYHVQLCMITSFSSLEAPSATQT